MLPQFCIHFSLKYGKNRGERDHKIVETIWSGGNGVGKKPQEIFQGNKFKKGYLLEEKCVLQKHSLL